MNKLRDLVNAILFSLFLASNSAFGESMTGDPFDFDEGSTSEEEEPLSTVTTFHLTKAEKELFEKKALDGDADAAFKLYMYFKLTAHDSFFSERWLLKSAELGNTTAQYNLVQNHISKRNRIEAYYWFNRLSTSNHPRVEELKQKLDATTDWEVE